MNSGTTQTLYGIWGSSGSDVFAVGYGGTILHYDGSVWSSMTSGTTHTLHGIWGSSGSDVFAVGNTTILHYSGPTLITWSSSSIPYNCTQIHVNPSVWACTSVNAIWGSSPTDVFAVGDWNSIDHFNGITWSDQGYYDPSPVDPEGWNWWYGIWGSSGNNVFAVGNGMMTNVYHYDGSVWLSMTSGTTKQLNGIWGSSGSDVFVVGNNGTILHYDGSVWAPMTSGTTQTLYGIWGSSGSDVFAVDLNGTILHYDGSVWSSMTSGTTQTLYGIWGSSGSDVFAVGLNGTILHYGGTATVISVSSFTATPFNREVIIKWSTESETDNAGFNIYRSETADGEYTKINTSLISAKGSSTQGASYEYVDTEVKSRKTYYYKLEDIDFNGKSTMHGPVSATPRWIFGIFGR